MSVRGWADKRKGKCWLRANISLESEVPEESPPVRQRTGKDKANEGHGGPRREGYLTTVSREHERTKRGWADFRKDPSAKSPTLIPTCHAGIWLSAAFEQPLFGLLHPSLTQQGAGWKSSTLVGLWTAVSVLLTQGCPWWPRLTPRSSKCND